MGGSSPKAGSELLDEKTTGMTSSEVLLWFSDLQIRTEFAPNDIIPLRPPSPPLGGSTIRVDPIPV